MSKIAGRIVFSKIDIRVRHAPRGDDMKNEKFAATLFVGDAAYTYYPVEQVEGSAKLPDAL